MSTLLITGSRGFLGNALCYRARNQGNKVLELDTEQGDIADKDVFGLYLDEPVDHVFHLAARTYIPDSWQRPYDFFYTNVMGTENVLEFCRKKSASLTFVSAYIYGQPEILPITEEHPVRPNNPYAQSKYLAEQLCEFYAKQFQVRITVIRPFNIFGPGQSRRFLIPHIIAQVLHDDVIKVKDLHPRRDYVYIDDVVDALMLTMKPPADHSTFNIGSGYSISVQEIIDIVQEVFVTTKPVNSEGNVRQNELSDVVADISKAARLLLWKPKYSFLQRMTELCRTEKEQLSL